MWEFMFPGVDKQLLIPDSEEDLMDMDEEEVFIVHNNVLPNQQILFCCNIFLDCFI